MTKLTIACTARTLFDLDESHQVFMKEGIEAYSKYQLKKENNILEPGPAYQLVSKLLRLNTYEKRIVEVVLLSRNSAETGLRVYNSIHAHGLDINKAVFTRGASPTPYIAPFGVDLFLSSDPNIVKSVLKKGYAAATVLNSQHQCHERQLKVAFDGDAVIFSDESEKIYKSQGLDAFTATERINAKKPLNAGPFKNLLERLHKIQSLYRDNDSPIRTAIVTARATPTSERVIRTLRSWNLRVDEIFFLGGTDKGKILKEFGADIFFDDKIEHCESAKLHVATGHVPNALPLTNNI